MESQNLFVGNSSMQNVFAQNSMMNVFGSNNTMIAGNNNTLQYGVTGKDLVEYMRTVSGITGNSVALAAAATNRVLELTQQVMQLRAENARLRKQLHK